MGSLMAGWRSPSLGTNKASLQRKASFTRDEIEAYWKTKRNLEEEHSRAAAELAMQIKPEKSPTLTEKKSVEPDASAPASLEEELEKLSSYKDWWTKSSWAFLNEPAMKRLEAANYRYTTQHNVAAPSIGPTSN